MSLICLCVVKNVRKQSEIDLCTQQIEMIAKHHKRGIKYFVDWSEPFISSIQRDSLVINIVDSPESNNCELFLLPDGWFCNGQTDRLSFRERMKFLQDISNVFINRKYRVDLYLGQSGTCPEEVTSVRLCNHDLVDYLTKTIGIEGADNGMHICLVP